MSHINIRSTADWVHALLNCFNLIDWRILKELIMDKNPKFLSKFWITFFIKLGLKLLYNIAYYPQIDSSSKCINQTIEITLRFFIYDLFNPSIWPKILPKIQLLLNNTTFSTTSKISNKIIYKFSTKQFFDLLVVVFTFDVAL